MRLAAQDRRGSLIEAATLLFSTQGFDGTTTREIAEAAGVSEAIIFRHFANKEELYWAVISNRMNAAGRKEKIQQLLSSGKSPAEILGDLAATLLDRNAEDVALTRLLLFSALRNDALTQRFFRTYLAEAFEWLADYIRRQISEGSFRKLDPMVAARGFLGMIVYHNLVQELFGGNRHQQFDPRKLGQQLAEIWLNGMGADIVKPEEDRIAPTNQTTAHVSQRKVCSS